MNALELAELIALALEDDIYVDKPPYGDLERATMVFEDEQGTPFIVNVRRLETAEDNDDYGGFN